MAKDPEHLPPYKKWDWLWRSTFELEYRGTLLVADVDFFDFSERIRLYRDGDFLAAGTSPAELPVDSNATVEAALSLYGMQYIRLVHASAGTSESFRPSPGTGEDRRARFAADYPGPDRIISLCSWIVLTLALLTQVPEILNVLGRIFDISVPTFQLPTWLNTTLQIGGILAGLDRALRMKFNRWIDDTHL
ncbi:hypothetical protein IEE92_12500 [Kocuria sp. cx-116]|uniref:hypothetical protein n=1 Tax=Kocuria sp. cx-116 TaxID=2771378 RepID=UPI0016888F03|nr:hypothetical protein [Kocuria sp. cx-116]MBD2763363.1 hypothetical protein [Kocuria sp. cx-116]